MYRGFYTLTSGMFTQQTNLNTISNNMANMSTPGYKKDRLAMTTFEEMLISRTGNMDKSNTVSLNGSATMIMVPDITVTDYTQGIMEETGRIFDFSINGEGFFEIQTPGGERLYTRNGSFTLDDEGYLFLQHIGRVMGDDGQPIYIGNDDFKVNQQGDIMTQDGLIWGRLGIVDFADYGQLRKTDEGMIMNPNPANQIDGNALISWKILERSNVEAIDEITGMITSQRAFQSASQILKMYDSLMEKAVNDIGRP